ncbi:MAG: molybdopterin-dependent oxidoreductase [Thermoleophilia bacterium]|jgi:molybdopterin guanine dinucleotide-containing S/N-oxide reductase-like protein
MGKVETLTNSTTGGPVFVDIKDGKIIRIYPMDLDNNDAESWCIEARGKKFTPPRRTTVAPYTAGHKSMIYSPKRVLTPLKRVDFDPNGERNPQNRGTSGYEPISWDEALDICCSEIKRIKRTYGPGTMLTTCGSHHLWGIVGYRHSAYVRWSNLVGMVWGTHNPDSWEGWHWGGMHMWGFSHRNGIPEQYGLLEDALKHTDMIVFWSADPDTTGGGIYSAFESTVRRLWLKELGVKMVFVDPYYNHTAGLIADKWFSPRMGTDVAFGLGIAYTWLTEDLYDKEYVETRTHGFGEWKAYVLGESDGVPKTPEWAENECRIPARDIRAFAREWGSKKTMLAAGSLGGWGGAGRSATGNEWARTMIALITMQGLGKPGINLWGTCQGSPADYNITFPGYGEGAISGDPAKSGSFYRWGAQMWQGKEGATANAGPTSNPHDSTEGQMVPRLRLPEALMHERFEHRGKGFCAATIQSQFQKYEYPAPGYGFIRMLWRYGASFIGTMTQTNRYVKAYRQPKLEFAVSQVIWFEGEAQLADIILPACTNFERWDISEFASMGGYGADSFDQCNNRIVSLQKKCIEPLGESKSDYDIFAAICERLGIGELFTQGGKTDLDWVKQVFHASDISELITWDEFFEKGYFVIPPPKNKTSDDLYNTTALRWFAEDRVRDTPDWGPAPNEQIGLKGLQTQSGKIEFVSNSLKNFYASEGKEDPERPPLGPTYIPSWEGHHTTELFEKYPLAMVSPHPRFSFHTMGDGKESWMNQVKDHRVLVGGHYYWVMRLNTKDAEERGIKNNDLIRAYNDRGSVILAAQLTERLPQGTVHSYESCAEYDPIGTPGESPDQGGCINILTNIRYITPTSQGMSNGSCLLQVEKWDGAK